MKCILFELTHLPDDSRTWNNADEYLTLLESNNQPSVDYDVYPPFLTTQLDEEGFNLNGTLGLFCFADNTKINCLMFYEGVSFDLLNMNDQTKELYFTMFHQYNLSWSTDVSMRSREVFNADILLKRLYSVFWAEYGPVNFYSPPLDDFYNTSLFGEDAPSKNDITYADLAELDSSYDNISNPRKMVCNCQDKESFGESEIHHCFNVDNKKNWSLISSYVYDYLSDVNNVSDWAIENTFIMENDTSLE
jgi:hypothetical protein